MNFSSCFCINSTHRAASCSLLARNSRGVVEVYFLLSSSISFLQSLSVCTMIWICSSTFLRDACALPRILVKTSFSFVSKLSLHCFSSFVSIFNYLTTSSKESFPFLVSYNSAASVLACDCTSYTTLTCSLYSSFVGIFSNTNSTYARYFNGFWAMASSICIISDIILKLGLVFFMVWMVSYSFGAVLSSASIVHGINSIPLSCLCVTCICSRTFLILANSLYIVPSFFLAYSNSSTA